MTGRDPAALLSWAAGELWAMEAGALERLTARMATMAARETDTLGGLGPRRPRTLKTDGIAVLRVNGIISNKPGFFSEFAGGTAMSLFTAEVNAAAASPGVKGIAILFDSPGGTVGGVAAAAAAIRTARRAKPVVAIVDDLAASAAFWLASQASKIIIVPGGNTGSLGVFGLHVDLSEALKKAGIKPTFIASTAEKVELSPFFPLSAEAKAAAQREVDLIFNDFLKDVALGRGLPVAVVKKDFGRGRLVNARDALRQGLVDGTSSVDRALQDVTRTLPARGATDQLRGGTGGTAGRVRSSHPSSRPLSRQRRLALLRNA